MVLEARSELLLGFYVLWHGLRSLRHQVGQKVHSGFCNILWEKMSFLAKPVQGGSLPPLLFCWPSADVSIFLLCTPSNSSSLSWSLTHLEVCGDSFLGSHHPIPWLPTSSFSGFSLWGHQTPVLTGGDSETLRLLSGPLPHPAHPPCRILGHVLLSSLLAGPWHLSSLSPGVLPTLAIWCPCLTRPRRTKTPDLRGALCEVNLDHPRFPPAPGPSSPRSADPYRTPSALQSQTPSFHIFCFWSMKYPFPDDSLSSWWSVPLDGDNPSCPSCLCDCCQVGLQRWPWAPTGSLPGSVFWTLSSAPLASRGVDEECVKVSLFSFHTCWLHFHHQLESEVPGKHCSFHGQA